MEHFLIRHTIAMPVGEAPLQRHYSLFASSREEAFSMGLGIDDGRKPYTTVEVVGHVVDGWPVFDLQG